MKPDSLRTLLLSAGTKIGIVGEFTQFGVIHGRLKTYVVLEREFNDKTMKWDTAIVMSLTEALQRIGITGKVFFGNELLLIHRYPNFAWDNSDPTIHVFGLTDSQIFDKGPIAYSSWQPYTIWLEGHATMFVDDPSNPSELSKRLNRQS